MNKTGNVTIQVYFPSASFLPRDFGGLIKQARVSSMARDCFLALDMIPRMSPNPNGTRLGDCGKTVE